MDGDARPGLAEVLEEIARLRERNRTLAQHVQALRERLEGPGSQTATAVPEGGVDGAADRPISRRRLLAAAGTVAAGAVMLGTADAVRTRTPAEATVGTMMYGTTNDAGLDVTSLSSYGGTTLAVQNTGPLGVAVFAAASTGRAVFAVTLGDAPALYATNGGEGGCIVAELLQGSNDSDVIHAATQGVGNAIYGETSDIGQAVQGRATGQGYGVVGHTASDYASGVYGTTTGGGAGVQASSSSAAPALKGGSQLGRGAVLSSEAVAQLQLTPSDATTHPKHGERGDLFVDKKGHLWFCKKSGASATWAKLA